MLTLPRLKKYKPTDDCYVFNSTVSFKIDDCKILQICQALINHASLKFNIGFKRVISKADVTFKSIDNQTEEYYEISITKNSITVFYTDSLSARNAVSTLISLAVKDYGKIKLPACDIKDYPDFYYRSAMIDLARKFVPLETLKLYIRIMAVSKYNKLHLHLLDTEHYALKSEFVKGFDSSDLRQYTKKELKEIVDYANSFGIDVVPEIDLPAHGLYMLSRVPEIKCKKDGLPIGKWALCVSNEKSYEFTENLIAELSEIFTSSYIHLGGDELSFYDLKELEYWPSWFDCDSCKSLAKNNNYKEAHDFFCHYVRNVYKIAKKYDKSLIIWSDAVDTSKKVIDLPRDILIQFWRVAMPGRGPHEGCSMQRFLEEGFKVINSNYRNVYADDYVKEMELLNWSPTTAPETDSKFHSLIIGAETCAWDVKLHYCYTFPAVLMIFADRLWNKSLLAHEASYGVDDALFRQLITPISNRINIFTLLGQRLFPTNEVEKIKFNLIKDDVDQFDKAFNEMEGLLKDGRHDNDIIIAYTLCLQEARLLLRQKHNIELPHDLL